MKSDIETDVENVLVVLVDALCADKVGAFGCEHNLTPHIDAIAKESTIFENAYASSNTTDPSLTTIHTGRYPLSTVRHHGGYVTADEKSRVESVDWLPSLLKESGFKTVATGRAMGRWHKRGFDRYPISDDTELWGQISRRLRRLSPRLQTLASDSFNLATDHMTKDRMDERMPEVDTLLQEFDASPFYGFVHLDDTHTPYEPPTELVEEMLEKYDYPTESVSAFLENHSETDLRKFLEPWLTEDDYDTGIGRIFARYDAAVRFADEKVGYLIEALEERDLLETTALFITSDHGESLGEHGIYFDHHGLYDETIQVPLLLHLPNHSGERTTELVSLLDIAPTVLDLVDENELNPVDGKSLIPLVEDDSNWESRDAVFAEEAFTQRRYCVRTGAWKLIRHTDDSELERRTGSSLECRYCNTIHGGETELYDLTEDWGESKDVSEENRVVIGRLQERYEEFSEELTRPDSNCETITYDDEDDVLERLEDLGYR